MLKAAYPPEPSGPLRLLSHRPAAQARSTLSKHSRTRSRTHRFLPSRSKTKRKRGANWRYVLYQFSFSILIVLLAVLLVVSAYGIGEQAFRVGGQRRWNIVVLSGAYVAIAIISIMHFWSRLLTIKRLLRTIPKPYMPTKELDMERVSANHIMSEYSRTAVIAHISQATTGVQEGWGRPGTKWADKHFRTEILATLPGMFHLLAPRRPHPPLSLQPLATAADNLNDKALVLFINSYIRLIEQARYARREPTEQDAEAVIKVTEVVRRTIEVRKAQGR